MKIIVALILITIALPSYSNESTPAQKLAIENLPPAQRKAIQQLEAELEKDKGLYENRPYTKKDQSKNSKKHDN